MPLLYEPLSCDFKKMRFLIPSFIRHIFVQPLL